MHDSSFTTCGLIMQTLSGSRLAPANAQLPTLPVRNRAREDGSTFHFQLVHKASRFLPSCSHYAIDKMRPFPQDLAHESFGTRGIAHWSWDLGPNILFGGVRMKKRVPVAIGGVLGVVAGLWLGSFGDGTRPTAGTFLEAPVHFAAMMLGRVFAPGEWGGLYFLIPLWCLYWSALGSAGGYLIWRLFLRKTKAQDIAEPCAPPNGGPAALRGNSGVKEGPPSVS